MTDTTEHSLRPEHVSPAEAAEESDVADGSESTGATGTDDTGPADTADSEPATDETDAADPDDAGTTADTDADGDTDAGAGSGPDPRLLEELDEHIRAARAAAEETLGDSEYTFVESGDEQSEAQDDQTIAPPG